MKNTEIVVLLSIRSSWATRDKALRCTQDRVPGTDLPSAPPPRKRRRFRRYPQSSSRRPRLAVPGISRTKGTVIKTNDEPTPKVESIDARLYRFRWPDVLALNLVDNPADRLPFLIAIFGLTRRCW
ncbi:MAG TPA: hypothetical protein VLC46_20690 [Thermoanaerobaculia bacterium]|jgi:hypothetical protein|nr:hypothetical protein [Thermoanaerobaculia bacterium]